ncbi:MAG: protein kinase [Alphaproteobacteria bacterium]|nr:protein kinase [Alphaproteobacteria bacterium]
MNDGLEEVLAEANDRLRRGDTAGLRKLLDRYDQTIERRGLARDPRAAASWHLRLVADRLEGRPEDAIAAGSRLVRVGRSHDWNEAMADVLRVMALSAMDLSDLERARVWFEESLNHAQRVASDALQAGALRGLGLVWELRGERNRFHEYTQRSLELAERANDRVQVAEALTALGRYRIQSGDAAGEEDLIRAAGLFEAEGESVAAVKTLFHRLPLAIRNRDVEGARALIDAARKGLAETVDNQLEGMVYLDGGEVSRMEGDIEGAREQYRKALELFGDTHPLARIARMNLVLADIAVGDLDAAANAIPALLVETQDHTVLNGIAHLLGLAIGPTSRGDTEDDVWARHGTPARLALENHPFDPDVVDLAERAVRRMARRADAIQAGRAAVVMGLATDDAAPDLVKELRRRNAALPIGPFLALQKLGAGGMGEVWLGRHVDSDTPAALKVVSKEIKYGDAAWEIFDNEMKAVSALSHPNIVGMLDHGRAGMAAQRLSGGKILGDSPYLALQYVRGGTLTRWIGRMDWSQIRVVLTSLLDALAHAHARSVLHLDLKPDNILLAGRDPADGVRLTDFGLALLRSDTRQGIAGTLEFMAPEQYVVGSTHGPWTDLYALGCLAWGLLTEAPPFHSKSKVEMAELHSKAPLPKLEPTIPHPKGFEGWVRRLLEKDPSRRYTRASDALIELLQLDEELQQPQLPPADRPSVMPTRSYSEVSLMPTVGANALETIGRPAGSVGHIRLPETWRMPETTPMQVPDAGLALVHEREPILVGRRHERDHLWELVKSCYREDRPKAVMVSGPLGSGRRALLKWLAARTHELGFSEVVWHDAGVGFGGLLDGPVPEHPAALAVRVMRALHKRRGNRLALVLLDPHDAAVPEFVDIAVREGEGAVLFAMHAPARHAPRNNRLIENLELPRLPDDDIRKLLTSVLPLQEALMATLVEWADGNPGLALATLRDLARRGELRASPEGWRRPHGARLRVPGALATTVRQALERIANTPVRWECLQVAAAYGNIVHRKALTTLCGDDITELTRGLCDARVLEEKGGVFRWLSPAARHLVSDEPATRIAHGRIADHLAATGAPPALVASHFVAAHRYADAHRPLLDAVKSAIDNEDREQAAEFYRAWLDALDRLAVRETDPRRLAGRKYASLLAD